MAKAVSFGNMEESPASCQMRMKPDTRSRNQVLPLIRCGIEKARCQRAFKAGQIGRVRIEPVARLMHLRGVHVTNDQADKSREKNRLLYLVPGPLEEGAVSSSDSSTRTAEPGMISKATASFPAGWNVAHRGSRCHSAAPQGGSVRLERSAVASFFASTGLRAATWATTA